MNSTLVVSDLRKYKHWVPLVAQWHHSEWLRHRDEEGGLRVDKQLSQQRLSERLDVLSRHLSEEPLPTTYIAHEGSSPVGTVSLVYYRFTKETKSSEWLTNLFVLPEYRRRGIASTLLNQAIAQARELKLKRLLLYTKDQAAFYRKRHWRLRSRGLVQGQEVDIMDFQLTSAESNSEG